MSSSSQVGESWISSFCNLLGHEYFAEVSEDFIEDDFNLTGLQSQVPMYKEALEMILDVEPEEDDEEEEEEEDDEDEDDMLGDEKPTGYRRAGDRRHLRMASDVSMIESSAELLYGLIHQRYITSRPGISQMAEKYELQHFGLCPRVHCKGSKVLPVGLNDTPGQETVKLFCPSCLDVYTPPNSRFQNVDGAFFGTTFGYLFFMSYPDIEIGALRVNANGNDSLLGLQSADPNKPSSSQVKDINGVKPQNLAPGLGKDNIYEPRIYGFRVSERSRVGPRMQWLRDRPDDVTELDETKRFWDEHEMMEDADEDFEDEEEDDEGLEDSNMLDTSGRRKPDGKRRRIGRASPMDTNGIGDGR
jgi:casein kinase II subunit beta